MAQSVIEKYGLKFLDHTELEIEFAMIRHGGFVAMNGKQCGLGLYEHYKNAMTLCWPEDDWHRWATRILKEVLENTVCCLLGPKDASKTYSAAKFALIDYWCHPLTTMVLVSSTDLRGLELRVWGAIKGLYNRAVERWPELPGHILESLHAIATADIDEKTFGRKKGRVLNQGLICIPCLQGGRYIGLSKYAGIKQKRIVFIADECGQMGSSFLDAVANLGGKEYFKFIPIGNPHDPNNPLGRAAEPLEGWASVGEPKVTTSWKSRFMNGVTLNLVGTDSPNFDFPPDPPKYPYLIHQRKLDEIAAFWTKDSERYYFDGVGVMKTGLLARRVITREMCREHHALERAIWEGTDRTRIYAIDAAYSGTGGDRCVAGWGEFGMSHDGIQILRINPQVVIPVLVTMKKSPEDQIAEFVKKDCTAHGIDPENIFYDSTGRGTLGAAFARVYGDRTPQPVEFGGKASASPVRHDLFVQDGAVRRHKRCDEHYLDMVSQLWFSARYTIESDQMRELPEDCMVEGCGREYGQGRNNRVFVESKHDPKARERMVRSPDLFDQLVTLVHGAIQRGFKIQKLGASLTEKPADDYYKQEAERWKQDLRSCLPKYV